jgi:hypothetical protein
MSQVWSPGRSSWRFVGALLLAGVGCGARTLVDDGFGGAIAGDAGEGTPGSVDDGDGSALVDAHRTVDASTGRPIDAAVDALQAPEVAPVCQSVCALGTTECAGGGIATCVVGGGAAGEGCAVWGGPVACSMGLGCESEESGVVCIAIEAPRPIAPLSTSTVTSHEPTFRWALAGGDDGGQVEIYRDRACTEPVTTFLATGASGAPATELSAGVYFWRVRGAAGASVGAQTSPVWELVVGVRSAPVDSSWGTMLDVNGDGFADVALPDAEPNFVAQDDFFVYLGGPGGLSSAPLVVTAPVPADSEVTLGQTPDFAAYGPNIASAGDVNGDGFGDLIIGAPVCCGEADGAAFVYLGGPSGLLPLPTMLEGSSSFAFNVASAGDVNGDGYADVLVDDAFNAHLYLGGPDGIGATPVSLTVADGPAHAAGVGDVNGDGFGDVVVAAFLDDNWSGSADLYLGSAGGLVSMPVGLIHSAVAYGMFAYDVEAAGDVNGDGYADVIVGAAGYQHEGLLYPGGAGGLSSTPTTLAAPSGSSLDEAGYPTNNFGRTVAGVGDMNGDGFADVALGAPLANGVQGAVYVYFGGASGLPADPSVTLSGSPGAMPSFGQAVVHVGDVDGDGFADLAVFGLAATVVTPTYLFDGASAGPQDPPTRVLQP